MTTSIDFTLSTVSKSLTMGSIQSVGPRAVGSRAVLTYDLLVVQSSGPDPNPIDVNEIDVSDVWSGNGTVAVNELLLKWDSPQGQEVVYPWHILTSRTLQRDQGERLLFRVTEEYMSKPMTSIAESELYGIAIPGTVNPGMPYLREEVWGEDSQIIYKEAPGAQDRQLKLPTGTFYAEPFFRRYPVRQIRQTQFEEFASKTLLIDAINARMFTLPTDYFAGVSADTPRWMITNIDYQKVFMDEFPNMYMMTYDIEYNMGDGGWTDRRALIDKFFMENGKKAEYRTEIDQTHVTDCLLNPDGTKKADQTGDPTFIDWNVQPRISWIFLRDD